jgi:hypothetical protein
MVRDPSLFGDFSRKIPFDRFATEPAASSLCLIQPANLRWVVEQTSYNPHKASAQFQQGGTSYRLPITDPAWLDAFRTLDPGKYPITACGIAGDSDVLLTLSLSEPWEDGYCYKLVSAILPVARGLIAETMDPREAAWIIQALAGGTDPYTGERLPHDGPLSNPDTIKALRAALAALASGPSQKKLRDLPAQAGKAWDEAEDATLVREFDAGATRAAMAKAHGRTLGAIKARLILLGKIPY